MIEARFERLPGGGSLQEPERAEFEAHANSCATAHRWLRACAGLVGRNARDGRAGETAERLVYSILDKTLGPRETGRLAGIHK